MRFAAAKRGHGINLSPNNLDTQKQSNKGILYNGKNRTENCMILVAIGEAITLRKKWIPYW